jgi:hypothetical protein
MNGNWGAFCPELCRYVYIFNHLFIQGEALFKLLSGRHILLYNIYDIGVEYCFKNSTNQVGAVIDYYGVPGEEWKLKAAEPICLHCGSADKYYAVDGIH